MKFKHLAVMVLLLVGLALSGCVGESPQEQPADEQVPDETVQEALSADEILVEEDVGLTDSEIADLETEMDELAALLEDIESVENISIEEL